MSLVLVENVNSDLLDEVVIEALKRNGLVQEDNGLKIKNITLNFSSGAIIDEAWKKHDISDSGILEVLNETFVPLLKRKATEFGDEFVNDVIGQMKQQNALQLEQEMQLRMKLISLCTDIDVNQDEILKKAVNYKNGLLSLNGLDEKELNAISFETNDFGKVYSATDKQHIMAQILENVDVDDIDKMPIEQLCEWYTKTFNEGVKVFGNKFVVYGL